MKSWAELEIEKAIQNENCDYSTACYNSALKAYNSLVDDDHSGMSLSLTMNVLNRLTNSKPLTPITEKDFDDDMFKNTSQLHLDSPEWLDKHNLKSANQCPRYFSLFKYEYKDGTVEYHDIDRVVFVDNGISCSAPSVEKFLSGYIPPITLPYMPSTTPIKIFGKTFIRDDNGNLSDGIGEFNCAHYTDILFPNGTHIDLDIWQYDM